MSDREDLWRHAAAIAERAHIGQTRHDGFTPYAAHPARVAMTVAAVFGCDDPEALAIAWLHDVIEDSTIDYEDLLGGFGSAVADGVAALSKNPALPEAARESAYDAGLERADWRAKLVKLADVTDNMADAGDLRPTKRGRLISRAERAIAIAERDDTGRPELIRAAASTRRALDRFRVPG